MVEALLFWLAVGLSPIVMIAYLVLAWRHFVRRRPAAASPGRTALAAALIAFPFALFGIAWRMLHQRSSTAAIALLYAPALAAVAALAVFLLAWAAGVAAQALRGPRPPRPGGLHLLGALLILAVMGTGVASTLRQERRLALASDERASPAELEALAVRPAVTEDPAAMAALAGNPHTPGDVLLALARSSSPMLAERPRAGLAGLLFGGTSSWSALGRVARNPSSPPAALDVLAGNPSPEVAAGVAGNPRTPAAALSRLGAHPGVEVARALARNPATPADTLSVLSTHPDVYVRSGAANHRGTPPAALVRLSADPRPEVRLAAAANPSAPPEVLAVLARSADPDTRVFIAANPRTPHAVLAELAHDADEKVRRYANQTLGSTSGR